jgi:hypothetical protein
MLEMFKAVCALAVAATLLAGILVPVQMLVEGEAV